MAKEIPLKDNSDSDFNRSLELSNINKPDVGDYDYLNFRMIYRNKETGEIEKTIKIPVFRILKTKNNYFEEFLKVNSNAIDELK